jgi:hypothetical protein
MIVPRKRWLVAPLVALLVAALTPSSAYAVPLGTVTGHVLDNGTPVSGVTVRLLPINVQVPFPSAVTDADGAFTITNVSIAHYVVAYQMPGNTTFYSGGAVTQPNATPIDVPVGATVTIEQAVPAHGSMHGRVTQPDGAPASGVGVLATSPGILGGNAITNANGDYTIPYLWPAGYQVNFRAPGAPFQWAHQAATFAQAAVINVAADEAVLLDEALLPTGTITGRVTNQGAPASASVQLQTLSGAFVAFGSTQLDGTYRVVAFPGTYVLQFRFSNGVIQYSHLKTDLASADHIVLEAGQTLVVDEQVLVPSVMRGTLVKADGTPAASMQVSVSDGQLRNYFTTTAADGTWQVTVLAGTYTVRFSSFNLGSQWAYGHATDADADRITVGQNATVQVNDQLAELGSLVVTARDKRTGATVSGFCVSVFNPVCTTTGTVTLPLLPGHIHAFVSPSDQTYLSESTELDLASGQTVNLAVDLTKASTVTALITDAATGAPVANACLSLVEPLLPTSLGATGGQCSAADGTVTLSGRRAGVYNAFVEPRDGVHGRQWVGYGGGVGAQAIARLIVLNEGATVALPTIKLDGAGSIEGVVTDAATGTPLANAYVALSSVNAGFGPSGLYMFTDAQGHYRLDGLGPYAWTLFFGRFGYAAQFSGSTGDRFLARGVPVTAGQTATYNQPMEAGETITGTLLNADGSPPTGFHRITLIHALTGDELGANDVTGSGPYTLRADAPILVKLKIDQNWVGGSDFLHARVYLMLPGRTTTANITLG